MESRESCIRCGKPIPSMPEDAAPDEMLCNTCYDKYERDGEPQDFEGWLRHRGGS